jgi:hypothetical protein
VTDAHEFTGLGAVRSLGRAGHRVTAAYPAGGPPPASAHSRYCAARATYPDPWQSQGEFARRLIGQAPEVDLILPISEAALLAAVDCRPRLASRVIAPAASYYRWRDPRHRRAERGTHRLTIAAPAGLARYLAPKGPWIQEAHAERLVLAFHDKY